jgi:hypothetical protein
VIQSEGQRSPLKWPAFFVSRIFALFVVPFGLPPFPLGVVVAVVVAAVIIESSKQLSLVSVNIGKILPPSRTAAGY